MQLARKGDHCDLRFLMFVRMELLTEQVVLKADPNERLGECVDNEITLKHRETQKCVCT